MLYVYCCKRIFLYRFSPETFGYTLVCRENDVFRNLVLTQIVRQKKWGYAKARKNPGQKRRHGDFRSEVGGGGCKPKEFKRHWLHGRDVSMCDTSCSPRVRFPVGLGIFLFITASRTAQGPTQPPIKWVPGALSLGVRRPGREADHSPPSSTDVKK
jgi:hypothetical protein